MRAINDTRLAQGLPPFRSAPKTHKCAICSVGKARLKAIPKHISNRPMHPTPGCECPRCVPPEVISDLPPMHTISVDLIGSPKNVASVGGCRWAIVIIDRGTRYCWVKLGLAAQK